MDKNDLLILAREKMPIGKHQGTLYIDLPEHYVVWACSQNIFDGKLGKILSLLYEIKLNGLEYLVYPLKY